MSRKKQKLAYEKRSINNSIYPNEMRFLHGDNISPDTAQRLSAVYTCQKILAESVAMLPLILYKQDGQNRVPATNHNLYNILYRLPNPETTSYDLRATITGHAVKYGNGFAQKVFNDNGELIQLWQLLPQNMVLMRDEEGELVYVYHLATGERRAFLREEILHIRGLSNDGIIGFSPISEARMAFESANSMEQYGKAFYDNDARPGGILTVEGLLDEEGQKLIRKGWNDIHSGSKNASKIAILEAGTRYTPIGTSQADQQFLEQKKFSRDEIAAIFRIPAHMLNSGTNSSYGSLEEMSQQFIDYSLNPWLVQWEQAITRDLIAPLERDTYYAKHKVQALLRGNSAARAAFYGQGLQWGYYSINDVRQLEDLNPIEGGDSHFVPMNMAPLNTAITAPVSSLRGIENDSYESRSMEIRAEDKQNESLRTNRVQIAKAQQPMLKDAATRITKREVRDIQKQVDKYLKKGNAAEFGAWIKDFYTNGEFSSAIKEAFLPILTGLSTQMLSAAESEVAKSAEINNLNDFVNGYVESLAYNWTNGDLAQIEAILNDDTITDKEVAVTQRVNEWNDTKPAKVADQNSFEAVNALAIAAYGALGITVLRWLASGTSCAFCQSLSGKVVGIEGHFVKAGTTIDGGVNYGIMEIKSNHKHGPLHRGCDCIVVAG